MILIEENTRLAQRDMKEQEYSSELEEILTENESLRLKD